MNKEIPEDGWADYTLQIAGDYLPTTIKIHSESGCHSVVTYHEDGGRAHYQTAGGPGDPIRIRTKTEWEELSACRCDKNCPPNECRAGSKTPW